MSYLKIIEVLIRKRNFPELEKHVECLLRNTSADKLEGVELRAYKMIDDFFKEDHFIDAFKRECHPVGTVITKELDYYGELYEVTGAYYLPYPSAEYLKVELKFEPLNCEVE